MLAVRRADRLEQSATLLGKVHAALAEKEEEEPAGAPVVPMWFRGIGEGGVFGRPAGR